MPRGRRRTVAIYSSCALLIAAAVAALVLLPGAVRRPPSPVAPVAQGQADSPSSQSVSPSSSGAAGGTVGMPGFVKPFRCQGAGSTGGDGQPLRICIPQIRVDASVLRMGLNDDRTVQVPALSQVRDAGWYRYSALPGAVGPTVILGHVDSAQYGDGVFYRLSRLHTGNTVSVARADGQTALFEITKVIETSKKHFPTQEVYGPTSGPALRLVTCGGRFDSATGNYEDNIIAFGTLRSLRAR